MADQTIANRQFFPLATQHVVSSAPSTYSTATLGTSDTYQGQSFHDILNRTQLTSAQLRSMQAPQNQQNSMLSTYPVQNSPKSTGVKFVPDPASPYNQQQLQETQEHLKNMPVAIPEDEMLDELMVQNMQQYLSKKGEITQKDNPSVDSSQSIQTSSSESTLPINSAGTSSTLHAILARNAVNPQTLEAENLNTPIQQSKNNLPIIEPIPILEPVPLDPEINPEPAPISGFPAYIPAAQIGAQITAQTSATQTSGKTMPSKSQQDITLESQAPKSQNSVSKEDEIQDAESDNHQNKGFFQSVGSFFGNIASAVTLGFYRPPGDVEPQGFARVVDPLKKVVWDAPKSLIVDAPVGAYHDLSKKKTQENKEEEQSSSTKTTVAMNTSEHTYRGVKSFGYTHSSLRRNYYS